MKMKNIIKKQQKQYLSVLCQLHYLLSVYALSVQHTQQIKTMQNSCGYPGLTYDHSMELSYAEEFSVDYYNDGYALITINQEGQFLVVPEGKRLQRGLKKISQLFNNR